MKQLHAGSLLCFRDECSYTEEAVFPVRFVDNKPIESPAPVSPVRPAYFMAFTKSVTGCFFPFSSPYFCPIDAEECYDLEIFFDY